jgi:methoxymalonate biosynthesis acyl carrier protein
MTTEQIKAKIAGYLVRFFPGHVLREDEDIFSLGFVNSMFAMQLVTFVEHEFGFTVENEDLELDNFRSINALAGLVERKRPATAAG